jgi:hypothetical protein
MLRNLQNLWTCLVVALIIAILAAMVQDAKRDRAPQSQTQTERRP